jgi:outer membrane protein OmpA-like peptidoglycan-associated protein
MAGKKDSYWIPLADLMTVLMVIFLFMAISYMVVIKKKQDQQNEIFKEYEKTKVALYNELDSTFKNDFGRWDLQLDNDLSIKFTNPQVLFAEGRSEITPYFQNILSEFLPKYLRVVLQDKYQDKIAEIRIEGHTNAKPIGRTGDPYIDNMELSQGRARNVLAFLRTQLCFTALKSEEKQLLQYWLTANGLSYGRMIDESGHVSVFANKEIDNDKSRRVEFRIVTTSDEVVNEAIMKMKKMQ